MTCPRVLTGALSVIGALLLGRAAGAESTTLTTYYPAPFGVYDTLVFEQAVDYNGGAYSVPPVVGTDWFLDPSAKGSSANISATLKGRVGIGTSAPTQLLDVVGGDIRINRPTGDSAAAVLRFKHDDASTGGSYGIAVRTSGELAIRDFAAASGSGADRLAITSAGRVILGGKDLVSSPTPLPPPKSGFVLDVAIAGGAARDVMANDYYVNRVGKWAGDGIDATAGGDGDWQITGTNMYSIPGGKVGIGTSSPSTKLHVVGGDGRFDSSLGVGTSPSAKLHVAGGNARFDGSVGIGITSPTEKLDVSGNIKTTGKVTAGSTITGPTLAIAGGIPAGRVAGFGGDVTISGDIYSLTHYLTGDLNMSGTISAKRIGTSPGGCVTITTGKCYDGRILYSINFDRKEYECCYPQ